MAKTQTFADKSKKRDAQNLVTVKFIKCVKTESGSYKFHEKLVKLDDVSKVTTLK